MSSTSAVGALVANEREMHALISEAQADKLTDDDIAELASRLADSGLRLGRDDGAADVASTGGISSLSTLLCPLQLRVRGYRVPKLGVAGRPAGGVDVLQTVPGYDAHLSREAVEVELDRAGYVHLLADEGWAPLDAQLFAYRQRTGTQGLPPLVIASLLAKKLAAGTVGAGLEIRVASHGNFGSDFATARLNAERYIRVARLLKLRPTCALTDASQPYQPYIGRGEAVFALWTAITDRADSWLGEHIGLCKQIADAVAADAGSDGPLADRIGIADAQSRLLRAHGTSWDAFEAKALEIRDAHRSEITADAGGIVEYRLEQLRSILVQRQRDEPRLSEGMTPDPVGVVLHARPGERVMKGDILLSVRAPSDEPATVRLVSSCVTVHTGGSGEPTWNRIEIV